MGAGISTVPSASAWQLLPITPLTGGTAFSCMVTFTLGFLAGGLAPYGTDVPSEALSLTFVKSFITASVFYLTFVCDLTLLVSGTASNLSDSLATSLRLLELPL